MTKKTKSQQDLGTVQLDGVIGEAIQDHIGSKDIIGIVEMEFIKTVVKDIHAGRGTIGNCVDDLLSKLDNREDKLRKVTVYIDEERM